jgi:type IV secretory pathway TrbF-like protein
MGEKQCNHCGNDNQDSFAMELLKGYSAQAKRWFIACLVILSMWLATIGGFVWYLYQYDFESYEITADGDSNANYIGEDGNIYNGGFNQGEEKKAEK